MADKKAAPKAEVPKASKAEAPKQNPLPSKAESVKAPKPKRVRKKRPPPPPSDEVIRAASDEELREALSDPKLPAAWRKAYATEQVRREEMTIKRYLVVKDCQYVVGGYVHQLRRNAAVASTTHDIAEMQKQGIPLELVAPTPAP
jgi:hypothetical protein